MALTLAQLKDRAQRLEWECEQIQKDAEADLNKVKLKAQRTQELVDKWLKENGHTTLEEGYKEILNGLTPADKEYLAKLFKETGDVSDTVKWLERAPVWLMSSITMIATVHGADWIKSSFCKRMTNYYAKQELVTEGKIEELFLRGEKHPSRLGLGNGEARVIGQAYKGAMKDLEATKARQAASKEKWSTRSGKRVGTGYTILFGIFMMALTEVAANKISEGFEHLNEAQRQAYQAKILESIRQLATVRLYSKLRYEYTHNMNEQATIWEGMIRNLGDKAAMNTIKGDLQDAIDRSEGFTPETTYNELRDADFKLGNQYTTMDPSLSDMEKIHDEMIKAPGVAQKIADAAATAPK